MQANNPAALWTVLRTASKLAPFDFNDVSLAPPPPCSAQVPRPRNWDAEREARRLQEQRSRVPVIATLLCPVCRAPLHPSRPGVFSTAVHAGGNGTLSSRESSCVDDGRLAMLCTSCAATLRGLLDGADGRESEDRLWSALPPEIRQRCFAARREGGAGEVTDNEMVCGSRIPACTASEDLREQLSDWLLED